MDIMSIKELRNVAEDREEWKKRDRDGQTDIQTYIDRQKDRQGKREQRRKRE